MVNAAHYHLETFYGTAKIHKMSPNDSVQHLPIRPTVSNTGNAKYLASLLIPLSESEYTIKNSKSFVQKVKLDKIPSNYKIVSFDVKSLTKLIITEKLRQI